MDLLKVVQGHMGCHLRDTLDKEFVIRDCDFAEKVWPNQSLSFFMRPYKAQFEYVKRMYPSVQNLETFTFFVGKYDLL